MRTYRKLILFAAVLIVFGSIGGTSWYACRMHSVAYRQEVERDVTAFFAMPATIGDVQGRTFDSRDFVDVVVRLPNDGDVVFKCKRATWIEEGRDRHFLALTNGTIALATPSGRISDIEASCGRALAKICRSSICAGSI